MSKLAIVFGGHSPISIAISKELSATRRVVHYSRSLDTKLKKYFLGNSNVELRTLPSLDDGSVNITDVQEQIQELSPSNLVFAARYRGAVEDFTSSYKFEVLMPIMLLRLCSSGTWHSNLESSVLFCSPAGRKIVSDQGIAYHVHKAAIEQIIRYFAVKGTSGRINGVSPGGFVLKDRNEDFYSKNPDTVKRITSFIPTREFVTTLDIAQLVDFLISNKSKQINGQIITIDGGYSAKEESSLISQ